MLKNCTVRKVRTGAELAHPAGPRPSSAQLRGIARATNAAMLYRLLAPIGAWLLDLFALAPRSARHQDLPILRLRPQLRLRQRYHPQTPRVSRWEQFVLAVLVGNLTGGGRGTKPTGNAGRRLFQPDPVRRGPRAVVRRPWTFPQRRTPGRPAIEPQVTALVRRLAQENSAWGYGQLQGALRTLGPDRGRSTVSDRLKRPHGPPAPQRAKHARSWGSCLRHDRQPFLAGDFLTVETAWLNTLYVFFFIERGSRRVHWAGCTAHPTAAWGTQQARQLTGTVPDAQQALRFLIRDRAAQCTASCDPVVAAEGSAIVQTPYCAPRANALAARWLRSVRGACLERRLLRGEGHRRQVLIEYGAYDNGARPHPGIEPRWPLPRERGGREGAVKCRDGLGGIIPDYYREAA